MMRILSEIVVALSTSAAMSLLVKGTGVVTLGLVCAWLARRSRAAVRHAFLTSAFVILLVLPIVSLIAPPVTIRVPVLTNDREILALVDYNLVSLPGQTPYAHPGAAPTESGWSLRSLAAAPLSTILLYGWLIGIALFVIPVIGGLLQVRSLRRFGLAWRDGQAVAESLVPGARRAVTVLLSESLPGPMTCGVLRPVVVLPEDAQSWDEKDLERALVHELEHVRRYDWAIYCLSRVACAAYWFHPLVWAAWRQLTLEAERSCDDAVLDNSEATAYADQLLGLARRRFAVRRSPALAMANRSYLAARIAALLDGRQARGPVGALLVTACAVAMVIVLGMSPLRVVAAPRPSTPAGVESIPKWDAVSIRRCTNAPVTPMEGRDTAAGRSPDRQTWDCSNVRSLIDQAYSIFAGGERNFPPYPVPIERLPSWADSERYTIEAKSEGSPGAAIMRGPMLQALLKDRFGLEIRRENREGRVYLMTAAKGGPKLPPFQGGCTPISLAHPAPIPAGQNSCRASFQARSANQTFDDPGFDMDSFALWITRAAGLDGPLLNKTGLTGYFHFHVEFLSNRKSGDPGFTPTDDPPFPSIFTAMPQQLGLKVDAAIGPREFLVVDHLEKPSEN
jgi:uncharacterized protein (TIGR03435 family)